SFCEELGVAPPDSRRLARSLQAFDRVLANRLEHPEPFRLAHADEALVDERLKAVDVGVADRFGSVERAAFDKDTQAREQTLLLVVEEVVRPLDRGAQRPLAQLRVPASAEKIESRAETVEQLRRRQHRRARRRELERERQVVEAFAEVVHELVGLEVRSKRAGACDEEL